MIASRHITKVVSGFMAAAVILVLCAGLFSEQIVTAAGGFGVGMEYESRLFDKSEVLQIDILMDEDDWQAMLNNAMQEEYVQCDVEIDGETFYQVGIRPKGNTSLSSIAMDPDTDRYSLKLEFDQYVDGQTCFGLDKLILNNNYADATNLKEALIYELFDYVGADASLYNFARVSVNGQYWGLYLALEAVEESFLLRNYGTENGKLYKPDSMNMAGGGGGGFGGGMFGGGGANLNYSDDSLSSYSTIWAGAVTDSIDADHKRVVTALKNAAQGTELERYLDTDNLVKYAAVHIFSANSDSLSGSMAHNYYLYESDGRLNLLPWDYNLALGGMGMGRGSAENTVNSPIDDAWNGTNFLDALLADEEYHAAYDAVLEQVADYILNGGFEDFYSRTRVMIDELAAADPNAFYTYEEYLAAVETLHETVLLRGQSIAGQLEGSIPSTDAGQQDSDTLINAAHIDLEVMGTMSMGGGDRPAGNLGDGEQPEGVGIPTGGFEGMTPPDGKELPEGFDSSQFGGQMPVGGFEGMTPPEGMELPEGVDPTETVTEEEKRPQEQQGQQRPGGGNMPGMSDWSGMGQQGADSDGPVLYAVCGVVLAAGMIFALFYKRRPRR